MSLSNGKPGFAALSSPVFPFAPLGLNLLRAGSLQTNLQLVQLQQQNSLSLPPLPTPIPVGSTRSTAPLSQEGEKQPWGSPGAAPVSPSAESLGAPVSRTGSAFLLSLSLHRFEQSDRLFLFFIFLYETKKNLEVIAVLRFLNRLACHAQFISFKEIHPEWDGGVCEDN